jgi:hypothetical protein
MYFHVKVVDPNNVQLLQCTLHPILWHPRCKQHCNPICAVLCVLLQVLLSATEAAEMILRVDDIIRCAPRQRSG